MRPMASLETEKQEKELDVYLPYFFIFRVSSTK